MVDEFDGVFRYFQKKRKPLKLLNDYKGLSIESEVLVRHVDTSSITVKPESSQLVCLQTQRKTFIHDSIFPRTIEAGVDKLDILSGEVVLSGFKYSRSGIGDRRHLRVSPAEPVPSLLKRPDVQESIHGILLDLSREGLAVKIMKPYPPGFTQIGVQLIVQIHLPASPEMSDRLGEERKVEGSSMDTLPFGKVAPMKSTGTVSGSNLGVQGIVVHFRPEDEYSDRIGIHLLQRDIANEVMLRFIRYRQSQLNNELKKEYAELVKEETQRLRRER